MTLIELMVVVVILVTLVAGVLPLVSPNNDARKIRETSRSLQTFMTAAQVNSARTGGSGSGIGFRETSIGSGVAVEIFHVKRPPIYGGSSYESRAAIALAASPTRYGPTSGPPALRVPGGNGGSRLGKKYYGAQLYAVRTQLATNANGDPLPPGMIRIGDVIHVEKKRFKIVDDPRNGEDQISGAGQSKVSYIAPSQLANYSLICVWMDEVEQGIGKVPPLVTVPSGERYFIVRQPSNQNALGISAQPAYQFPAGIAIDFNASGYESNGVLNFFVLDPGPPAPVVPSSVEILFSANGGIDSLTFNGNPITDFDRVFLLVGRVENGALGRPLAYNENCPWYLDRNASDEELITKREEINWLNPESRWLMMERAGNRLTVTENALVDPRKDPVYKDIYATNKATANSAKAVQIEHAHELAHGHSEGDRQ